MSLFTVIFIAAGLAMDCLAVSITSGFACKELRAKDALKMAIFFGGFQVLMLLAGWFVGTTIVEFISAIDHWIAFGLLCAVGGKMIYESTRLEKEERTDHFSLCVLLTLAVATSIDSLAVGLSMSFLNVTLLMPAVIIGATSFILSFAGAYIGKTFGHFFESKLEMAGGLILIGIGIKILFQHLAL